ncbi:dihydroneopterin aldolase [Oceanisphaera psychrotolerans]|uniref:7,8-dihydroneopterin aldolase n=1 Tax=Oceanisphaera psychrotolerans TaxID=1414654 RepID=A0A1J4Q9G2_9GAMM|nr:dihydroneopterin aldolase [Oceanisphaera psychrotolerans]OIN03776.1 dihydroneopterin aldolase [Oceanisphaera psychrotolerans]
MDKVFVQALEVLTTIGAYEWEKSIKQKIRFDLEMRHDNRPAALGDDLTKALDYAALSQKVTRHAEQNHVELVETMAEQIAQLILAEFPVHSVKVRLTKPGAVANAAGVGVEIERFADDSSMS